MRKMKKVFIAGGITYDLIINLDTLPEGKAGTMFSSKSKKCVGGTGAGKALNLSRLGFETTLHAFVGNDDNGEKVKEYMASTRCNFIAEKDERGTESFTNLIDKNGQRISILQSITHLNQNLI
jgi:sugar/nucleoside kinase (ribokinase family)